MKISTRRARAYRRGIARANFHEELARFTMTHPHLSGAVDDYVAWDAEKDPLRGKAFKAYARRMDQHYFAARGF
jgi:hypothetical protein